MSQLISAVSGSPQGEKRRIIQPNQNEYSDWYNHNLTVLAEGPGVLTYFTKENGYKYLRRLTSWENFLYWVSKYFSYICKYLGYYYNYIENSNPGVKEILNNLIPMVSLKTFSKFPEGAKERVISIIFFQTLASLSRYLFNRNLINGELQEYLLNKIPLDRNRLQNDPNDPRPQYLKSAEESLYEKARFAQLMIYLGNFESSTEGCSKKIKVFGWDGKPIGIFKHRSGSSLTYRPNLIRSLVSLCETPARIRDFGKKEYLAEFTAFQIEEIIEHDESNPNRIPMFTPTAIVDFNSPTGPIEIGSYGTWYNHSDLATNYFGIGKTSYRQILGRRPAFPQNFFEQDAFYFFLRGDQDCHAENILTVFDDHEQLQACIPIDAGQSFPAHYPKKYLHLGKPFLIAQHENAKKCFSQEIGLKICKALREWKTIERTLIHTYEHRFYYNRAQLFAEAPIVPSIERANRMLERLAVMFILHEERDPNKKREPISNLNNYRRRDDVKNYIKRNIGLLINAQDDTGAYIFSEKLLNKLSASLNIPELLQKRAEENAFMSVSFQLDLSQYEDLPASSNENGDSELAHAPSSSSSFSLSSARAAPASFLAQNIHSSSSSSSCGNPSISAPLADSVFANFVSTQQSQGAASSSSSSAEVAKVPSQAQNNASSNAANSSSISSAKVGVGAALVTSVAAVALSAPLATAALIAVPMFFIGAAASGLVSYCSTRA